MEFIEFCEKIKESVCAYLGEETQGEIRQIVKNNGVRLNGLLLNREADSVSPTIYLEGFYREYKEGKTFGKLVREIAEVYEKNRITDKSLCFDFFTQYEAVRGRIFHKVVNYEKNRESLHNIPHIRFLDLALVCYYAYMNDILGQGSIQIDIGHLDQWGITEEALFSDAWENTTHKLGVEVRRMDDLLEELLRERMDGMSEEEVSALLARQQKPLIPMYIMSVRGSCFGAACLYHKEWLAEFADRCGKNLYILPSSIHELILIPDSNMEEPESLKRMVREVNAEHVETQEQLSDQVYYFDRGNKVLSIV